MSRSTSQKSKFSVLSESTDKKRQGTVLHVLTKFETENGPVKVQFLVYSDSYDFQSYARAEAFNPTELKWNALASLPFSRMASAQGAHKGLYADSNALKSDYEALLKLVEHIL